MSFDLSKKFELSIETDEPLTPAGSVGIYRQDDGTYRLTARGVDSQEQLFADLRSVLYGLFSAVETARRQHFTEEIHPVLTGAVAGCTQTKGCQYRDDCPDGCRCG